MKLFSLILLFISVQPFAQSEDKKETWADYNLKGSVRHISETQTITKRVSLFKKSFSEFRYYYYNFSPQGVLMERDSYEPQDNCNCCVPGCFQFDEFGNETRSLCNTCQGETRHEFEYDSLNRVVKETPHTGLIFSNPVTTYTYNNLNLLIEKKTIQPESDFNNFEEETTIWIYNADGTLSVKAFLQFNTGTKEHDTTDVTRYYYHNGLLSHQEQYSYGQYREFDFVKIDFYRNDNGQVVLEKYTYSDILKFEEYRYKYDEAGREIYTYKFYNQFDIDSNQWIDKRRIETNTYNDSGVLIRNTVSMFKFNKHTNLWQLNLKHVYEYDTAGNLIYQDWSGLYSFTNEYTYDAMGNWITCKTVSTGWSHYKYPIETFSERVIQYY